MPADPSATKVPHFENEAQEARWWDEHQSMVEAHLLSAMRTGTAQRLHEARDREEKRPVAGSARQIGLPDFGPLS